MKQQHCSSVYFTAVCRYMDLLSKVMDTVGLTKLNEIEEDGRDDVLGMEVMRELDRIEREGTAKSSLEQAQRYARKFQDFLSSKGIFDRIETCEEAKLNAYLRYHSYHTNIQIHNLVINHKWLSFILV
jgi:hypothetical protein